MKKTKKEKKYDENPIMDVFMDLYKKTVDMSSKPTKEQKDQAHEELHSKYEPTDVIHSRSMQRDPIVIRPISYLNLSVIPKVKRSRKLSYMSSMLIQKMLSQNPSTIPEM